MPLSPSMIAMTSSSSSSTPTSEADTTSSSTHKYNTTVCFSQSYAELMLIPSGDCVVSETFSVNSNIHEQHQFCLKLYPRGGWSWTSSHQETKTGFGMAYQQQLSLLFSSSQDEKVGVYLQYLPQSPETTVDATFALRMVGRQLSQRFDVEWRAGMRFGSTTRLGQGIANDFGTHLMQTRVLPDFLGIDNDDDNKKNVLQMQVELELHQQQPAMEQLQGQEVASGNNNNNRSSFFLRDMRDTIPNDSSPLRVGSIVVPVLRKLAQRPALMEQGVYPGVEYRVLRMTTTSHDKNKKKDLFYYQPRDDDDIDVEYDLKPIYPLVPQLERPWPVTVPDTNIPQLVSPRSYNIVSAVGSLAAAASALGTAFLVSTLVSLFVIPSRSMEPTVEVGDVLLVEKITPRLFPQKVNSIVLFTPPPALATFVQDRSSGGRTVGSRDLFVKRIVAAQPGDRVTVFTRTGNVRVETDGGITKVSDNQRCQEPINGVLQYLPKEEEATTVLRKGEVMVLGDCGAVSIDSRVWGTLPESSIVGRPLLRVWPLSKVGPVE